MIKMSVDDLCDIVGEGNHLLQWQQEFFYDLFYDKVQELQPHWRLSILFSYCYIHLKRKKAAQGPAVC